MASHTQIREGGNVDDAYHDKRPGCTTPWWVGVYEQQVWRMQRIHSTYIEPPKLLDAIDGPDRCDQRVVLPNRLKDLAHPSARHLRWCCGNCERNSPTESGASNRPFLSSCSIFEILAHRFLDRKFFRNSCGLTGIAQEFRAFLEVSSTTDALS